MMHGPINIRLCYFVYLLLIYVKKPLQISCSVEMNLMTWHILLSLEFFFLGGAEDNDENNCHQSSPKGRSKMGSPEQEVIHALPHPPYSPDLAPCDFFLFPKLKTNLKGHHFVTVENVQAAATKALNNI